MFILRQSTAVDVLIGPFVDGTDGVSTEEALSPSVQLSKNGQTAATKNEGTTPAHDNAGYYNCVFNTTDTGTVGTLVAFVEGSTATHLAVRHEFQIMDTAAFDALFADGAEGPLQATTVGNKLDVSAGGEAGIDWANIGSPTTAQNLSGTNIDVDQVVASVSGAVASVTGAVASVTGAVGSVTAAIVLPTIPANWITAAGINAGAFTAAKFAAGAIDAAALAADAVQEIVNGVWDELMAGHVTADTAGLVMNDWQDGGRLDLLLDAIKVITDAITTTGTGLTALPWNAAWDTEVESEVNDALDTVISELGVTQPATTPTIRTALMLLYMALRNRTDTFTSGTDALRVYNDAGTIITTKALSDDGSDYSEAKMA